MAKRLIRTVVAVAFIAAAAVGVLASAEDTGASASTAGSVIAADPGWGLQSANDPGWGLQSANDPGWG
ncbi:hypothetical protein [Streptomyces sp. Da 82-17]|uniref:hypothetical protein n=1 Tax=Streptomyces sp. Da 82-17 TaxID=3377116 RepID=UPI0038D50589